MAVRTKRLAAGAVQSNQSGTVSVYTCPADETAIVKTIYVSASAATTVTVSLNTSGGTAVVLLAKSVSTTVVIDLQGWWVLNPGDDIHLNKTGSNVVGYWISGTELEGLAD